MSSSLFLSVVWKIYLILKKSNDQKSYLPFEILFKQTITNNNNRPGWQESVSVRHIDGNTSSILADLERFSGTLEISLKCMDTRRGNRYRFQVRWARTGYWQQFKRLVLFLDFSIELLHIIMRLIYHWY